MQLEFGKKCLPSARAGREVDLYARYLLIPGSSSHRVHASVTDPRPHAPVCPARGIETYRVIIPSKFPPDRQLSRGKNSLLSCTELLHVTLQEFCVLPLDI
jgi:hypothetical protein